MKYLTALFATLALSGCGTQSPSTSTSTSTSASLGRAPRLATLTGTTLETVWHCGGAYTPDPPQGPCSTLEPFATTFAVAKPIADQIDRYELVKYVTSDAKGHYSVKVPAGSYVLVTKYAITNDPADMSYTYGRVDLFKVKAGQTVTKDYVFQTPPPPIAIGVGNG